MGLTIRNDRILAMDVLADAARLRDIDLTIPRRLTRGRYSARGGL
jgi:hypothetical protein